MTRTVLISGCSSGIGRATAERFLAAGWTVYATARDERDVADLGERGCETAVLDVTDPDDVERVVERVVDERGRIDALVNNAGVAQAGALEDVPASALESQFDVNVFGPHRLARAVLPHMRERGEGTIVNVSSVTGTVAVPGMGAYSGAKHAMEGLSDALRVEVAPFGVDVALVQPGFVRTPLGEKGERSLAAVEGDDDPYARLHANAIAVKELMMGELGGDVEAVAETVVTAASASDPDPRYPVVANGRAVLLAGLLPDRVRDRVLERVFWGPFAALYERVAGDG